MKQPGGGGAEGQYFQRVLSWSLPIAPDLWGPGGSPWLCIPSSS